MPTIEDILALLTLRDYNTRLVITSTAILGAAAGLIGSFLMLRRRSLMGDALSHATLPGIAIAFLVMVAVGGEGKYLPGLLAGAAIAGLIGVGCVVWITRLSHLRDDTAMGIVLSVFFGLGVALLGVIQNLPGGNKAGLESFIYGKTASMVWSDFVLICGAAVVCMVMCLLFYKELKSLCFDANYARSWGLPTGLLDAMVLALVCVVVVIGLQAVGLILIIALLITPPAAARFWTHRLGMMLVLSVVIGAASGYLGSAVSALFPRMPAGAIIVVVAAILFLVSMLMGPARGVLPRVWRGFVLQHSVLRQHVLRAFYEMNESAHEGELTEVEQTQLSIDRLMAARSWRRTQLLRALRAARREGLVEVASASGGDDENMDGRVYRLTDQGLVVAARNVRNHRLWEMYLIAHADIAPSHVDRDADQVEHVLGDEMVARLEERLRREYPEVLLPKVPISPHVIE